METCKAGEVPFVKGDKLGKIQCPSNDFERKSMGNIPYASAVGSLMYAQVCTRPDIAFIVGVLGRYLSNPRQAHLAAARDTCNEQKITCLFIEKWKTLKYWVTQIRILQDVQMI